MRFVMRILIVAVAGGLCVGCVAPARNRLVDLPRAVYLDKCRGAWAGQMIGVAYGSEYEFRYNGRIQEDPIRPWEPEFVVNGLSQDDLYVEVTWLAVLEKYGLEVTGEQAGRVFAETSYGLAHANNQGRENVRHGIMPPRSGHPKHNRHADDIDFQIEADVFGIICPGLPVESNRLCDIFGHIMNHGDGVYGGMFVAGMYAAAYFENQDVGKVVRAGLACIPPRSLYHQCISDVIRWHRENPDDWRATWCKIEEKWQDDVDCVPGDAFNIDAKLNGAYIAVGLLYGDGDLERTLEVATRCGQDSDCNPSNAAGILGCMKGYQGLPGRFTSGLGPIENMPFANSDRTFPSVVAASQTLAEKVIRGAGGTVDGDVYRIPVQKPKPARLEQWKNQRALLSTAIPQTDVDRWDRRFKVLSCGHEMGPGYIPDFAGRAHVLLLVPKRDGPAVMEASVSVPDRDRVLLRVPVSSFGSDGDWVGDFRLKVVMDGRPLLNKVVRTLGRFTVESVDTSAFRGRTVKLRLEAHQEGDYHWERAYFGRIEFE